MSEEGKFLIYCIETYKLVKQATGRQIYDMFEHYGVLDYIVSCYGALHTTGDLYIVDDIDRFIMRRKAELDGFSAR